MWLSSSSEVRLTYFYCCRWKNRIMILPSTRTTPRLAPRSMFRARFQVGEEPLTPPDIVVEGRQEGKKRRKKEKVYIRRILRETLV